MYFLKRVAGVLKILSISAIACMGSCIDMIGGWSQYPFDYTIGGLEQQHPFVLNRTIHD
jgi:hypothetical protein